MSIIAFGDPMSEFLTLLAFLAHLALPVERVSIRGPQGVSLDAALVRPNGPIRAPAVVLLHGCGGPGRRDVAWVADLAGQGHIVLLPDSFGSRGQGPQCRNKENRITPGGPRRLDAIAAASWLTAQPGTPTGGVVLLGFSHGGGTVLWTARQRADLPAGLFRAFIAFYPGCTAAAARADYWPSGRLLLLIGEADNWTPAAPCRDFAARFPEQVALTVYPGAVHGFDNIAQPHQDLRGLAYTADGSGVARIGGDPVAAADARRRVTTFLEALPAR